MAPPAKMVTKAEAEERLVGVRNLNHASKEALSSEWDLGCDISKRVMKEKEARGQVRQSSSPLACSTAHDMRYDLIWDVKRWSWRCHISAPALAFLALAVAARLVCRGHACRCCRNGSRES